MAYTKQKRNYNLKKKLPFKSSTLIGALLAAVSGLLAVALVSFNAHDPSWFYYSTEQTTIHNLLGTFGAHLSAAFFYGLGAASYLVVPFLLGLSFVIWSRKNIIFELDRLIGAAIGIVLAAAILYIYRIGSIGYMVPGGIVGQHTYYLFWIKLDHFIATTAVWLCFFASIIVVARMSFVLLFNYLFKVIHYLIVHWRQWVLPVLHSLKLLGKVLFVPINYFFVGLVKMLQGADVTQADESVFAFEQGESEPHQEQFWQEQLDQTIKSPAIIDSDQDKTTVQKTVKIHSKPQQLQRLFNLPKADLFGETEKIVNDNLANQNKQLSDALEEKLFTFGVEGTVTNIKPGPVVTLFEYQPEMDAKVSKIVGLQDDLALALEAISVRIIAPIPGTSKVGFEVSNKQRKSVFMRDIVRSSIFQKSKALLPIVLGKDTSGGDVVVDLADMPHLLVAGSTGSGKSVALNTLLISLLCKLNPDQLKLIIIDPKRLEFASFADVPHLLFPIITQPHKAAPVLKWLVKTMEERYETMAQLGARSITDYKRMCRQSGTTDELPFIVVMIDELADLMMVARKEVEDSIARLAQMARAAGIHLIVATQRPSVDVLTGVIKVNFPSRMSFRVTSKVDSRTVLDALGAETLLGKGDMLFMDSHSARMRRIHGAYVADSEIDNIVSHLKSQRQVEYVSLEDAVAAFNQSVQAEDEPLLQEVIVWLNSVDEISISLMQRRFKIGYNRSARLIEILEGQGRIMPADGSKMRKVIH